ncbi:hypothetical protein SORBI_3002G028800 [Sorghum bicolor]|uniref:Uncharacterized protein n=1 Tax=Sorghum bicolor TaxID=4558 RepID=A0A1B6Q8W6_SORBI|nr:hypothetical protein SORBI_3002G028800 [Sorghum bicolor]
MQATRLHVAAGYFTKAVNRQDLLIDLNPITSQALGDAHVGVVPNRECARKATKLRSCNVQLPLR